MIQTTGTIGDSFITALKLRGSDIDKVHHTIEGPHQSWQSKVAEILEFVASVDVEFGPLMGAFPRIYSGPDTDEDEVDTEMTFFPDFQEAAYRARRGCPPYWKRELPNHIAGTYAVIQTNAGKPAGTGQNTKRICPDRLLSLITEIRIQDSSLPILVLSTDPIYEDMNLTERENDHAVGPILHLTDLDLIPAIMACYNADFFIGPEGCMSFAALSGQPRESYIFYDWYPAVNKRIVGTPWEEYCQLVPVDTGVDWYMELSSFKPELYEEGV